MTEITNDFLKAIQKEDPDAFGEVQVQKIGVTYFISGNLYTSIKDLDGLLQEVVESLDPAGFVISTLRTPKQGLAVTSTNDDKDETTWSKAKAGVLDEITTLFLGEIDIHLLTKNPHYKRLNFETFEKIKVITKVLGVTAPIIVDKNFKIIDGNLRLDVCEVLEAKKVPVMVLNCEGDKADFLRLVLNRSSEFQRWIYDDVDAFVDSLPQAQPLLEPLGFFSNTILPTTFFGNTVIEYTIDEYNEQMKQYSQDIGLAEWAKMRKAEILEEEKNKKNRRSINPSGEGKVSLFDLMASEEDFIKTVDPKEAVQDHVETMKVVADGITNNYDAKRKAEKEAKGQVWQTSRRTSKKLAADKRAAAEAEQQAEDLVDSDIVIMDADDE